MAPDTFTRRERAGNGSPDRREQIVTVLAFAVAIGVALVLFEPLGKALGGWFANYHAESVARGTSEQGTALSLLLAADVVGLTLATLVAFFGAVRLPSGMPHVVLAIFVPFTLAAAQERFFTTAGSMDGLAGTYGTYNFAAMFVLTIAVVQLGVTFARQRHESRGD
jgi:hypothetical protein